LVIVRRGGVYVKIDSDPSHTWGES
jgi:predicted transcriptional regulator